MHAKLKPAILAIAIAIAAAAAAVPLAGAAAAATPADLKWDLSYRSALKSHPVLERGYASIWPGQAPQRRAIHAAMAAYQGEPIEASMLIERQFGRDAIASWIIKTRSTARLCVYNARHSSGGPCRELDLQRSDSVIREVLAMSPPPVDAASERQMVAAAGQALDKGGLGMLSVYVDGVAMQRVIGAAEQRDGRHRGAEPGTAPADPLAMAMARLTMADDEFADYKAWQEGGPREGR
jgi:hypothetical protein